MLTRYGEIAPAAGKSFDWDPSELPLPTIGPSGLRLGGRKTARIGRYRAEALSQSANYRASLRSRERVFFTIGGGRSGHRLRRAWRGLRLGADARTTGEARAAKPVHGRTR